MITLKQGHKRSRKGLEPLVELLQGAFATDGIAEEHSEKVDHLVVSEAPSRKAHPFADLAENIVLAKSADEEHPFAKPARGEGLDSEVVWIFTELSAILVICTSLRERV